MLIIQFLTRPKKGQKQSQPTYGSDGTQEEPMDVEDMPEMTLYICLMTFPPWESSKNAVGVSSIPYICPVSLESQISDCGINKKTHWLDVMLQRTAMKYLMLRSLILPNGFDIHLWDVALERVGTVKDVQLWRRLSFFVLVRQPDVCDWGCISNPTKRTLKWRISVISHSAASFSSKRWKWGTTVRMFQLKAENVRLNRWWWISQSLRSKHGAPFLFLILLSILSCCKMSLSGHFRIYLIKCCLYSKSFWCC